MAFEEGDGPYEEASGSESHQDDRMTIRGLGSGWCRGGVVLTLSAALGAGGYGHEEHGGEQGNRYWQVVFSLGARWNGDSILRSGKR
jgi:hypothetical protein